ncbi:methyl-accepting chemotaxis protein [Shewanella sp. SM101]|uniref:methyl-accepting chemotaxis protein n=1 Tax=unclassified Shewanella TaxID=196818 RepID=UPI0021D975B6|nr:MULTISPECIES: PAS domain-containing methyl-accepting chemotaxis protein [unclassified Shewanella]MCU8010436.1 methyl-accepting chemotaxis protein [Shewanella sp. SM87]MCU8015203.1 methyl-accepting chemotaxis protein [Shewanella sp. SM74]MCU8107478.1 methyl-accepting chemotaxis protein [Shewanella sp. SM101]
MTRNHSGNEVNFGSADILLSTTELDSKITYANPEFCKIAGFTLDELKGNPHNLVRHPDMPKQAFKDLWSFVQQGKSWMGPVKNRCKNGDYYWVNAYVTPIKDSHGKIQEYQSVRTKLDNQVKDNATAIYAKLNKGETPRALRASIDATAIIQGLLFFLCLAFVAMMIFTNIPWLLSIPLLIVTLISAIFFTTWRSKYRRLLDDAKAVFDNPLMSYIYTGHNDVVGNIHLALKMRKAEINAIVGRVNDVSINITDAANETNSASDMVAKYLAEQNAETAHIATAINQMAATVQDLAKTVSVAAQASDEGRNISEAGQQVVDSTVRAINELSSQLAEVDKVVTRLTEGCNSIGRVLSEISGIADQTNLLALNAAIEAARAGEQGRGFAVVADEVRTLAKRTQQSTKEINTLLAQLQLESNNAESAMKVGKKLSENCVILSEKTGESLRNIHTEVSKVSDMNTQISAAIEEQSVVTELVSKNIVRVNDLAVVSEENGITVSRLAASLLEQLRVQKSLIEQFRG